MSRPSGTGPSSLTSRLLMPLGAVYGAVAARRLAREGLDAGIPVLCVGNYHVGGAGKTPTVLALVNLLRDAGEAPIVLSRGYGGKLRGPIKVDPERHAAIDVGDEPLMMAQAVAVVVARDRVDGVALARSQGASVIVMDDGFQNPAIAKDASLIVIDGDRGLGNACVFPAGPLRAPLPPQLARTDALIIVGKGSAADPVAAAIAAQGGLVLRAHLTPTEASLAALRGKRVLAFAGIGDPSRFFRTLRTSGVEVVAEKAFADHHPFSGNEIEALAAAAKRDGLTLVTTEKDMARLGRGGELMPAARDIVPFAVTLRFDDEPKLLRFVTDRLFKSRAKKVQVVGWAKRTGRANARPMARPPCPKRMWTIMVGTARRAPLPTLRITRSLQRAGKMPLQHGGRNRVGLLQVDAPVFQFVERNLHAGDRAAHIGARRDHAEIAIQILHLRFAMARGTEFIQHGQNPRIVPAVRHGGSNVFGYHLA